MRGNLLNSWNQDITSPPLRYSVIIHGRILPHLLENKKEKPIETKIKPKCHSK